MNGERGAAWLLVIVAWLIWAYFAIVFHHETRSRHPVAALLWPLSLFWYSGRYVLRR